MALNELGDEPFFNILPADLRLLSFAKVMEHFSFFSYNGGHETPWHPSRVGKAAPTRHSIIEKGKSEP
ncbi:MAG: hypothetical protein KKH04_18210, partial [Proteobacteria bacterium]|nr:hypothetical protein [Pseudomonadota bacterium]